MNRLAVISSIFVILFSLPVYAENVEIVDSDTIKIDNKTYRMKGIDGPELSQKCVNKKTGKEWNCGWVAKYKLEALVDKKEVKCVPHNKGRYGRIIATCYASVKGDSIDLSGAMVSSGWALAYETYSLKYRAQESIARITGNGMWSSKFEKPWDYRKKKK